MFVKKNYQMFKGISKTVVFEIALGVGLAIILINVLSSAFARVPVLGTMLGHAEDAEDAEDLEHFGGRMRERFRGRRKVKQAKRKRKLRDIRSRYDDEASQENDDGGGSDDEGAEDDDQ